MIRSLPFWSHVHGISGLVFCLICTARYKNAPNGHGRQEEKGIGANAPPLEFENGDVIRGPTLKYIKVFDRTFGAHISTSIS